MSGFLVGLIVGLIADFAIGTTIITWHFRNGYFLVNPDKRDEYLQRNPIARWLK